MFIYSIFSVPRLTESMIEQNLRREAGASRHLARNYRGRPEKTFLLRARAFAHLSNEPEGKV